MYHRILQSPGVVWVEKRHAKAVAGLPPHFAKSGGSARTCVYGRMVVVKFSKSAARQTYRSLAVILTPLWFSSLKL